MTRSLDVYLYDRHAGELVQQDDGALTFTYLPDFLSLGDIHQISISLPLVDSPFPDKVTRPFFSGLLPEEMARRKLAKYLGVSEGNPFGLLEVIGGECAGALAFYQKGAAPPEPGNEAFEVLDDARLARIITSLHDRPLLAGEEGIRLSLAGVQDKIAVCLVDDQVALAKGGSVTTHILKPRISAREGTVENELFCMTLAKRMKLNAPKVDIRYVEGIPYYLIERYDRLVAENGRVRRLHQEDFCQALSVPPELKYEDEGGPGVSMCLDLIQRNSAQPAIDRLGFVHMLIFNYLIGNADAHGKNYSFLYREKMPTLGPVYDMLCTAAYPRLTKKMAMKIGQRDIPDTINLQQWNMIVPEAKTAQKNLAKDLKTMAENILIESNKLFDEFLANGVRRDIIIKLNAIIQKRAMHILDFFNSIAN
jgi:serine/threonine-protein kinase HipA